MPCPVLPFFTGISPCVYVSSVILLSACLRDSCTVFTSSPFPFRRVANEWRNTCQRTCFLIPARFAAGRMCFDIALEGHKGLFPFHVQRCEHVIHVLIVRA